MKKALSLLLVLALAACMAVPAFAEELTTRREQNQPVTFTVPEPDYTVNVSNTMTDIPYGNTDFNKVATVTITAGASLDTEKYGICWITMGTGEDTTAFSYGAANFHPQSSTTAPFIRAALSYEKSDAKPQQLYEIGSNKYDGQASFDDANSFSYDVYLRISKDQWSNAESGPYKTTLHHYTQAALKTAITDKTTSTK